MSHETKAAVLAVVYLAALLLMAAVAFRFVVPLIIEAHFYGSVVAASVAGLGAVAALAVIASAMTRHVIRILNGADQPSINEDTE